MKLLKYTLAIASLLFSMISFADQALDQVVAIVNKEVITQSQLNQQMKIVQQQIKATPHAVNMTPSQLQLKVLNQMIDQRLQLQAVKKAGIVITDQQLDQAIFSIAQRNHLSVNQLKQQIQHQGINFDQYRHQIRQSIAINQVQQQEVASQINITPQTLKAAQQAFGTPQINTATVTNPQYNLIDIQLAVADPATAKDFANVKKQAFLLQQQLIKGASLTALINSQTNITVNNLGWRYASDLPGLFIKPVASLSVKQFSSPIRAPNGYHILQLVNLRGDQTPQINTAMQANINLLFIRKTSLMNEAQLQSRIEFLRQQIIDSKDFAAIARKNSQDLHSAAQGGAMGWLNPNSLPTPVEIGIKQLAIGEISQPIATANGYYVVQLLAKRQVKNTNQQVLQQFVYQRKFDQTLQQWLQRLRNESYIKILIS